QNGRRVELQGAAELCGEAAFWAENQGRDEGVLDQAVVARVVAHVNGFYVEAKERTEANVRKLHAGGVVTTEAGVHGLVLGAHVVLDDELLRQEIELRAQGECNRFAA